MQTSRMTGAAVGAGAAAAAAAACTSATAPAGAGTGALTGTTGQGAGAGLTAGAGMAGPSTAGTLGAMQSPGALQDRRMPGLLAQGRAGQGTLQVGGGPELLTPAVKRSARVDAPVVQRRMQSTQDV